MSTTSKLKKDDKSNVSVSKTNQKETPQKSSKVVTIKSDKKLSNKEITEKEKLITNNNIDNIDNNDTNTDKKEQEVHKDNESVEHSSKLDESKISGIVNLRNSMVKNDEDLIKINEDEHKVDLHTNDNLNTQPEQVKQITPKQNNQGGIFLTAGGINENKSLEEYLSYHDLIVPGGKNSRLCLIHNPFNKLLRPSDIGDHFKFIEPNPVINMIGCNTDRKGKLMAGISRAAYNTKSYIIDSGIQTGLETFCLRNNTTLIGIAPEYMIELPKPNPDKFSSKMLTNGHTHFILLGNNENRLKWGSESKFKAGFIERLLIGRKGFNYKCKTVGIIFGNINNCEDEILHVSILLLFNLVY